MPRARPITGQKARRLLRSGVKTMLEAASQQGPLPGRLRLRMLRCAHAIDQLLQSGALDNGKGRDA